MQLEMKSIHFKQEPQFLVPIILFTVKEGL